MNTLHRLVLNSDCVLTWIIVGFFAAWGCVRYLMDTEHKKMTFIGLLSQIMISVFTGFLGGFYAYENNYSNVMLIAFSGICSTLGNSLLRWVWQRFLVNSEIKG